MGTAKVPPSVGSGLNPFEQHASSALHGSRRARVVQPSFSVSAESRRRGRAARRRADPLLNEATITPDNVAPLSSGVSAKLLRLYLGHL